MNAMRGATKLVVHEGVSGTDSVAGASDVVERVVEELCRVSRTAALEFAVRIGTIVIERFYGGDTEQWRSRGAKQTSFRKLAAHPLLPMSPGALYRAVAICELTRRFAGRPSVTHLGCSHLRAVLGLSVDHQRRLLDVAYLSQWTVDRLEREAALVRPLLRKGGRRPSSPIVRAIRVVRRCVENELVSALDELEPTFDAARAAVLVKSVQEACTELENLVMEPACA
jgi:hypothetical protein